MTTTYLSALGISLGDLITTSYNTGPYQVAHISAPYTTVSYVGRLVILPRPAISLTTISPARPQAGDFYFNEISLVDGTYISGADTYTITKPNPDAHTAPRQSGLFDQPEAPLPPLYQRQPGVDYTVLDGELWKCSRCHKDFNAPYTPTYPGMIPGDPRGYHPPCPACGGHADELYVILPDERVHSYWVQSHGRLVQQYRQFRPERIAYLFPNEVSYVQRHHSAGRQPADHPRAHHSRRPQ